MTDLSPAAQAVLDAAADVYWDWSDMSPASSSTIAAAVLRAVVHGDYITSEAILAIAAELEELDD
jgi:hypothetical protein